MLASRKQPVSYAAQPCSYLAIFFCENIAYPIYSVVKNRPRQFENQVLLSFLSLRALERARAHAQASGSGELLCHADTDV